MKQMIKEAVIAALVCVVAYVAFGYVGRMYAQHKVAEAMAESVRMDSINEVNTDRTIVLKPFVADSVSVPYVTATVSGYESDVIREMCDEVMGVRELAEDVFQEYPNAYVTLKKAPHHNCIDCRLKAIAAAYPDGVWADVFDDCNEDDIAYQFEQILKENPQLNADFQACVKYAWGE